MQGAKRLSPSGGRTLLGSLWLLAALCAAPAKPSSELPDPGAPTRRLTLPEGETQSFEVGLKAGQFFQLLVEQKGVDLVVTLFDPQGRPLLEVDNPSGADGSQGPERVVWVAEVSGSHRVTIRGLTGKGGDYELTVEALRTAEDTDRRRAAAEESTARGDRLYGKRESQPRSIAAYEEALAGFRDLGDRSREADALYRIGRSRGLREPGKALEAYGEALRLYEEVGSIRQKAITLHKLCYLENHLGELEEAVVHCSRALPLWDQVRDLRGKALSSQELGLAYRRWGEARPALTFYDQSLDLWRRLGDASYEAMLLNNRGRLYSFLGERDQALADLEESLRLARELGKQPFIVAMLNNLGQLHREWREVDAARKRFQEALDLQGPETGYRRGISLNGLGWVLWRSGQDEPALRLQREAMKIFEQEGLRDWQGRTASDLGWLYHSQGRAREAQACFARAQTLFRALHYRSDEAAAVLGLAAAARLAGELPAARESVETALDMVEDLRARASASGDQRADFVAVRQRYDEFYVDLLTEMGLNKEALAASERGRARSLREMLNESPAELHRGVDAKIVARRRDLERQINAKEHQLVELRQRDAEPALFRQAEDLQRSLLRKHEVVQAQIRAGNPRYAALTRPEPLSVEEIQEQVLDQDTLLLEYDLGEERSHFWAVTSDSIAAAQLPPRAEIEDVARVAYEGIRGNRRQSRMQVRAQLGHLSHVLLGSVPASMREKKRLLVVGDGVLQYFPFAALPVPPGDAGKAAGMPLVTRYEIVSLPSASTLAVLREQLHGRPPAPGTLALLADPVFGDDDPRLSSPTRSAIRPGAYPRLLHAATEAEAILGLVAPEKRFAALGFDASHDVIAGGKLSRYRIVHFATHAELNTRHPELSRLVLSLVQRDGRPREDGLLHAYEIYHLEFPVELVVLSACETALGKDILGEGLIGLPRAFMYAGAARVVVSLWKVDDRATAELMRRFYEHLLVQGLAPGEALRAAQESIRRERGWQEPYFWAGFVLQGEWSDIHRDGN